MDAAVIGNAVKSRREAFDLTQQELADKAGISRSQVASLEQGKSTVKTLTQVCSALELELAPAGATKASIAWGHLVEALNQKVE